MKLLILIIFSIVVNLECTVITVDLNGSGDYSVIQEGVDEAVEGDTVLVYPGTYLENVHMNGINIILVSLYYITQDTSFINQTIIQGDGTTSTLIIDSGENDSTIISGFTISNFQCDFFYGGGVYCGFSSPILSHLTVSGNNFPIWGSGGGIFLSYSDCVIRNSVIENNHATYGGGIYAEFSNPIMENLEMKSNSAFRGGGICCLQSEIIVINSLLTGNYASYDGGGIWCDRSDAVIVNTTFSGNDGSLFGGGIWCIWNSDINLINSIMYNDLPQEICFTDDGFYPANSVTISYSDIEGGESGINTFGNGSVYWLQGNLDEDPIFIDQGMYPQSLHYDSPCIDAGTTDTGSIDLPAFDLIGNQRVYGETIDLGAFEWQGVFISEDEITPVYYPRFYNYPNPVRLVSSSRSGLTTYAIIQDISLFNFDRYVLDIFNLRGQKIRSMEISDCYNKQSIFWLWDGCDLSGKMISPGVYINKVSSTGQVFRCWKMIIVD